MSLLGDINDWLSGNPQGTADAASAAGAAADQYQANANDQVAAQIAASQGPDAAAAYSAEVAQDYSTNAPDPNSIAAAGEEAAAAGQGALQGAGAELTGIANFITKLLQGVQAPFQWFAQNVWAVWVILFLIVFIAFDGPLLVRRVIVKFK